MISSYSKLITRKVIGNNSPSKKKTYSVISHHCTPDLEEYIKGTERYKTIETK